MYYRNWAVDVWVLSCSPAPVRSVSSVNLVEKGDVVLPPPDYLGSSQTDKGVESAKGTTVKTPTDRPENAGPVSNQYLESKGSALFAFLDVRSWALNEALGYSALATCTSVAFAAAVWEITARGQTLLAVTRTHSCSFCEICPQPSCGIFAVKLADDQLCYKTGMVDTCAASTSVLLLLAAGCCSNISFCLNCELPSWTPGACWS